MIRDHQNGFQFKAELRPNNSGNRKGTHVFFGILMAAFIPTGIIFAFLGAWSVLVYVLVALLFFYCALCLNWRANAIVEHISIYPTAFIIEQTDHRGTKKVQCFPPQWLRVEVLHPGKPGSCLTLRSHGKSMTFGRFLIPDEHLEMAGILDKELRSVQQI